MEYYGRTEEGTVKRFGPDNSVYVPTCAHTLAIEAILGVGHHYVFTTCLCLNLLFLLSVPLLACVECAITSYLCSHQVPFKVVRVQSIAWVGTSPPSLPASLSPTNNYSIAIANVSQVFSICLKLQFGIIDNSCVPEMAAHAWAVYSWVLEARNKMTLSCYMHMLCVPAVFHVSWTLTRLTCGAKKHVSVGSVVRSLQGTQSYTTVVMCDYICYIHIILLFVALILSAVCNIYQIQTAGHSRKYCMHVLLAHVYLFHRSWPAIHRHCCTSAEASHKDTHT